MFNFHLNSLPDQLFQGPHQDHPLSSPRGRDVHRRAAAASHLQPRDDREVRLQRRARVEADLHTGEGGYHDERRKDQSSGRASAPSPTSKSGCFEVVKIDQIDQEVSRFIKLFQDSSNRLFIIQKLSFI